MEHLPGNVGKGSAIRRGLALASGAIVVIQDADLELSPSVINDLVEPIRRGEADAVYGSRFIQLGARVPLSRRIANKALTRVTNMLYGTALTDMETAHKAIRGSFIPLLELEAKRFEFEAEVTAKLARMGARFTEIPSPYTPRKRDEGKKIRFRDGIHAITTLLRFRNWRPLESRS